MDLTSIANGGQRAVLLTFGLCDDEDSETGVTHCGPAVGEVDDKVESGGSFATGEER